MEINENMKFTVSVKTLIAIGVTMVTVISMWFVLQSDIEEAKHLPKTPEPEITRIEFTLKDEMVRNAIFKMQKDLEEVEETLKELQEEL